MTNYGIAILEAQLNEKLFTVQAHGNLITSLASGQFDLWVLKLGNYTRRVTKRPLVGPT